MTDAGIGSPFEGPPVHGRVLIVEDQPVNQRVLERILASGGMESVTAATGEAGLEAAARGDIDLILLDIVLPGVDGYEVIRRLRADDATRDIPVIFISSLDDVADKVKGLELGGADYVVKPFSRTEVLARVRAQLRLRQLSASLALANADLLEKQAILRDDLRAAADIQTALLPPRELATDRLSVATLFHPSIEVGGDIFNVVELDHSTWAAYVADVSGHGVASALVTVSLTQRLSGPDGLLRTSGVTPAAVMEQLDAEYRFERFAKYFSIALAFIDVRSGAVRYTSAGHPPPIVARSDGSIERLEAGGPIIGMGFGLGFQEGTTHLDRGDRLVIYTDGVTEDEDGEKKGFGIGALEQHFCLRRQNPLAEACAELLTRLAERRAGSPPLDDIALVAIERR